MTERVADVVRRILNEQPTITIRFTFAIRPDSYHHGRDTLFLHPNHRPVVERIWSEK